MVHEACDAEIITTETQTGLLRLKNTAAGKPLHTGRRRLFEFESLDQVHTPWMELDPGGCLPGSSSDRGHDDDTRHTIYPSRQ